MREESNDAHSRNSVFAVVYDEFPVISNGIKFEQKTFVDIMCDLIFGRVLYINFKIAEKEGKTN